MHFLGHICHISQSAGGVETYILNVLRNTDRKKFRHTVICSDNGTLAVTAKAAGAEVIFAPMIRELSPLRDLSCLIRLLSLIRRLQPSLIHAHSGKGGIMGRICGALSGVPVVFTPNAFSYLGQKHVKRHIIKGVEQVLKYLPGLLVSSSPSEGLMAITEVGWQSKSVNTKFPNSIKISRDIVRHQSKQVTRIVMIGRLSYQKNPEMALRVANMVAHQDDAIRFTIIGQGYGDECGLTVKELMHNLQLTEIVKLRDWCPPAEVRAELLNSDIFLSTSRYEGLPYSVLEAMEKGLPIVATRIDGIVDLVKHGQTGFLTEIDDDVSMATYIMRLAADSNLRRKLGQAGREKIKTFYNIDKNIKKLEEIYYYLIASGR